MTSNIQDLRRQVSRVPDKPGVYIFKDDSGQTLYVGKGKSLRSRMSSYFQKDTNRLPRTAIMVKKIASFDFYVTANEVEALMLESNLIKQQQPPYNVFLRDDKSYPWIVLTLNDRYPRLTITREKHIKGNRYFGPYTNVRAIRENLDTLKKIFPLRNCRGSDPGKKTGTPCLNFHIKRCLGPCVGGVTGEEYHNLVEQVIDFLEGRTEAVIAKLEAEMKEAADDLEFEKAARLRNRITAAKRITEKQNAVLENAVDLDILGEAVRDDLGCLQLFQIRGGRMIGTQTFIMKAADDDLLTAFIEQYYLEATILPSEILLPHDIEDSELIQKWLKTTKQRNIRLTYPQRGQKKRLLSLAADNAVYGLELAIAKQFEDDRESNKALEELKNVLRLSQAPSRIECFDVSNISGKQAVASMVVFEYGRLAPGAYRSFKIDYADGPNDYEMMFEVVSRRLRRLKDRRFGNRPDLIILDGGKPQLSAALKAARDEHVSGIRFAALAKKEEELFAPDSSSPIRLEIGSPGLTLLKRLRDEAHRFAIGYHRRLRSHRMVESDLDSMPGIGAKRRQMLIRTFGSLSNMRKAGLEELESVLPKKLAEALYEYLQG